MDIEKVCFQIISLAGESFANMVEALQFAKKKDFELAQCKMEEAREVLHKVHVIHTELLVEEANGKVPNFSVILVHAQDNLMNTILAETIFSEMIDMYKTR